MARLGTETCCTVTVGVVVSRCRIWIHPGVVESAAAGLTLHAYQ